MRCDEAQELITARVDNELSAEERVAIDAHLRSCTDCSLAFGQESVLKRRIHSAGQQISAPAALRRRIETISAARAPIKKALSGRGVPEWLAAFTWRQALMATILLMIVVSVVYIRRPADHDGGITAGAFEVHASILSGETTLLRAVNLGAMRREQAFAVGDRFKPLVLDFSKIKLYPVAGFVRNIAGRDMLVTVYQGDGATITCFTFLGSEADAPPGAERFYNSAMKVNYYLFSREGLNGVLHQEGDVMCLLVSQMAPADMLAALRGKSAHG